MAARGSERSEMTVVLHRYLNGQRFHLSFIILRAVHYGDGGYQLQLHT